MTRSRAEVTIDARGERFRELYIAARPRIIAYALRRSPSPEDAADVVAEAFTIAWRRLDDVPGGDASVLWLYATARRVLANHRRSLRRRSELVDRIGAELAACSTSSSVTDSLEASSARLALARLSDDDRELLMLTGWEGLNAAQVACVLSCSATAARIRLHRARSRLASELANFEIDTKQGHQPRHSIVEGPIPIPTPEEPLTR
jgi:RNA polymerase sigma-70 factor (ECF subfamily)